MSYPAPPAPAVRRRRKWPWLVLGAVALVIIIAGFAGGGTNPPKGTDNGPASAGSTVVYEVTGTATDATIMYTTYSGGSWSTSTDQGVPLPWSKTLDIDKGIMSGGSLIVTTGAKGGTAACKVTVSGKEAKTATANGQFASASCTGF